MKVTGSILAVNGASVPLNRAMYARMDRNYATIVLTDGTAHRVRVTMEALEKRLGSEFMKPRRGTLVSARAIRDIGDTVNLINGERLKYVNRTGPKLAHQLWQLRRIMFDSGGLVSPQEYRAHYLAFENIPYAFADIEMVFDETSSAVDWVFRYGNPALAELEKCPLEKLIGSSFGSIMENMDAKWLRVYERCALFEEVMELVDYSPEIDTYLKVNCFPTFPGHCGCILSDVSKIPLLPAKTPLAARARKIYLGELEEERSTLF